MPEHSGARFFGEQEAAVCDDLEADMFDAAVVTPVVEVLADLATQGRALEASFVRAGKLYSPFHSPSAVLAPTAGSLVVAPLRAAHSFESTLVARGVNTLSGLKPERSPVAGADSL